jgi:hypothetical protein
MLMCCALDVLGRSSLAPGDEMNYKSICLIAASTLFGVSSVYTWILANHPALQQEVDIGTHADTEKVSHTFRLFNPGPRSLQVENISASCGCTVVGKVARHVSPFTFLSVPVEVTLFGKEGNFDSSISVVFADLTVAKLSVKGVARPALQEQIVLGKMQQGDAGRAFLLPNTVQIDNGVIFEDKVLRVSVEQEKVLEQQMVRFAPVQDATSGEFRRQIDLPLKDALGKTMKVDVAGTVRGEVEPSAEAISIGYISKNTNKARPVFLLNFLTPGNTPVDIDLAESKFPDFLLIKVEPLPNEPNRLAFYLDSLPPHVGTYSDSADLIINYKNKQIVFKLPVLGYVLEDAHASKS